jgi:hypothetical protein
MMARAPGAPSERPLSWLGQATAADLTSDGSRVLFGEAMPGSGASEVTYLRPTDGGPPIRLGEGGPLALSPDGAWALVLAPPADHLHLRLLPTGAGEPRELTRPGFDYSPRAPGVGTFQWGVWLPDSRHVIFNAKQNGGPLRLFVQDIVGGDPRQVGPEGAVGRAVSPDGLRVAGLSPGGEPVIYQLDGGDPVPCKGLQKGEWPIQWSPDGRSLICRLDQRLVSNLSSIEISTGRRTPMWQLAPADLAGATAPIAVTVTPDGKSYAYSFYRNFGDLYLVEGLK